MISGDVHGPVTNMGNYNSGVIANTVNIVQSDKSTQELLSQRYLKSNWPRSLKAAYNANLGGTVTREACTPGTRVDILKRIYGWALDPSSKSPSIFWLTGQAGSGKSTIAYSVVRHFDGEEVYVPKILGANFFCSRQFEETRQQKNIIPTIVEQLARRSESYANALFKANKFNSVDIKSKQMKDLLVDPWMQSVSENHTEFPPFLVVVDALDEIEDRGGSAFLEELLRMTYESHLQGIKFLITSRPDVDVAKLCSSFPSDAICALYDIPTDTVKTDIATYLQEKLPNLRGVPVVNDLMDQADGLFLFAATAVRYITPRPKMTKREQIQLLGKLGIHGSNVSRNTNVSPIDELYKQVMLTAFGGLGDDLLRDRLGALHTLLCTQERVSTSVAGELLSGDPDMAELVELIVEELCAVLYVKDDRVFWYHASFPDFIFSQARSGSVFLGASRFVDIHCEEAAHHVRLARSCFRIMKSHLRFNICHLPSSFLLDSEVPDLNRRIRANICDSLRYSCLHWAQHLAQASSNDAQREIRDFFQLKVLFWIEAMNLLGLRAYCAPMLQQTRECILKGDDGLSDLAEDVREAANFTTYFGGSPASQSTPHLYISSLATWSRDSILSRMWKKQFSHVPAFEQTGFEGSWPLLTIRGENRVSSIAFSSDGTRIISGSYDKSVWVWDASTGAELRRLNGHSGAVRSVAFSTDGTRIVSGSNDKSVRVWDASTGVELRTLNGHSYTVYSVAFSTDGSRIVSGGDHSVRIWDALTGAELRKLNCHSEPVYSVAFSTDGTRIISGSADASVRIWDASTGAELRRLDGHFGAVFSVVFSTDDTRIVSGADDTSVRIWNASTGAQLRRLNNHSGAVRSVAFSTDGTRIVSGSNDKSVRVWDASTGVELRTLNGHSYTVYSVAFSTDGSRIVSGGDHSVRIWDALTGAELRKLNCHSEPVYSVAFSTDGTRIISGSADASVRIWDASTGAELRRLDGHFGAVFSVVFSTDDTRIVSGADDTSVRIWNASTGAQLRRLNNHSGAVRSVAFSTDGTRIVSGSNDKSLRVWDASTGAELRRLIGNSKSVRSVAFSTDGTRIVSGCDTSVRVWDASIGAQLRRRNSHSKSISSVAFSSNGTRIVSGSNDTSVRVWDASTGAELQRLNDHSGTVTSVAFSNDGTRIVSGSGDESARVWDASTGAELRRLDGHSDTVTSAAFSSDDACIVSGGDHSVRIWDPLTGAELRRLNGHFDTVSCVAFSARDTRIVSGSHDGSVRVWDVSTGAELRQLLGHTDWVCSVAFLRDGSRIASGSRDVSARIWDASTGVELWRLNGHSDTVTSVAFSNNGTRVVSGSDDKSVRVWDALTGAELRRLNYHSDSIYSVAFSRDGTRVVSGSQDTSVRVWDVAAQIDPWELSSLGSSSWIVSLPHHQRLMWVPQEVGKILDPPCNLLHISSKPSARVEFTDCRIGPAWAACYTPETF